ncbi:MAG: hypothetical protein GY801_30770, partial [bacterium]|nr:hypothetical protein [bacterium]
PVYELFAVDDRLEEHPLNIRGFDDESRLQTLLSFRNGESLLQLQEVEIDIPPDLDQKLKDLGYIK